MREKKIDLPLPPGIRANLFKFPKITKMTTGDYASFGSVCSNILDLYVYHDKAGSLILVYTKFERVSLNDRQTDRWTDRQTDR